VLNKDRAELHADQTYGEAITNAKRIVSPSPWPRAARLLRPAPGVFRAVIGVYPRTHGRGLAIDLPETRYAKSSGSSLARWCDLVAGSGLLFENRGAHLLRGLPEPLPLYRAAA
jgi:hypothetical protein